MPSERDKITENPYDTPESVKQPKSRGRHVAVIAVIGAVAGFILTRSIVMIGRWLDSREKQFG